MESPRWRRRIAGVAGHLLGRLAGELKAGSAQDEFVIRAEVQEALSKGGAVVALESTIISHGMPYPQNVQTAREVEAVVRAAGAVPATIAILKGVVHIGLDEEQLEAVANTPGVQKASRRDLPYVISQGKDAATTVSATMILAAAAGIRVFVTGGIGGVHRGAESTMDVSADLTELGRTPIAVVCAGAKSVLDIPRTLEYLETQGVCVASYGQAEFPAFYSPSSGCRAPCQVNSPAEVAAVVVAAAKLRLRSGVVVGVPIPEQHMAEGAQIEGAIGRALAEAEQAGVKGNEVTPFLLKRITELTEGRSLEANIHLIKNNAWVGAQAAVEVAELLAAAARE
uniref:Pseudouridine-5'-phosphate glycosidase n=1 Tax=Tetraselmis chuii TaxID=63592 RepID=A0A7S1T6W5_9CHLO|mmetsp:Transcript_7104/g.12898  ORF Transcript_7104/g.12898 Transcript_7104/m.12898 type:complete len:340 (+) Transcript_7104:115-1134(+)